MENSIKLLKILIFHTQKTNIKCFSHIKVCKAARRERISEMDWVLAGVQDWLPPIGKDGYLPIRETHMLKAVP